MAKCKVCSKVIGRFRPRGIVIGYDKPKWFRTHKETDSLCMDCISWMVEFIDDYKFVCPCV